MAAGAAVGRTPIRRLWIGCVRHHRLDLLMTCIPDPEAGTAERVRAALKDDERTAKTIALQQAWELVHAARRFAGAMIDLPPREAVQGQGRGAGGFQGAATKEAAGQKNSLLAGSEGGGHRWVVIASLVEACKLNGVEPFAYLRDVLERMVNGYPANRLADLLLWNWRPAASV